MELLADYVRLVDCADRRDEQMTGLPSRYVLAEQIGETVVYVDRAIGILGFGRRLFAVPTSAPDRDSVIV